MATLLLQLVGPLQSYGSENAIRTRPTGKEPTKSAVIGILAAALGYDKNELSVDNENGYLQKLNSLRMGVRVDQEGTMLSDFQTIEYAFQKSEKKIKKNREVIRKIYLQDAKFLVGMESDDKDYLETLLKALIRPGRGLYLGRRCCVASRHIAIGIVDKPLEDALKEHGPLSEELSSDKLRMVVETKQKNPKKIAKDVPLSCGTFDRRFGYRSIETCYVTPPVTKKEEEDFYDSI